MISLLLCILLTAITYQDFRYRALSVYLLGAALVLGVVYSVWFNGWALALKNSGINMAFVALQIIGVIIYFSLKNKMFTNIFNKYLGSGDLLFYGVVAFCFSPVNFILFSLAAYLLILLVFAVLKIAGYQKTIPLAGCLAFLLLIMIVLNNGFHIFEGFNDELLMGWFVC